MLYCNTQISSRPSRFWFRKLGVGNSMVYWKFRSVTYIYSNTPTRTVAFWSRSVNAVQTLFIRWSLIPY